MALNQYEELAVLDQGDDGAIVSVSGHKGPSVLLSAEYLAHLDGVLGAAIAELHDLPSRLHVELLCLELKTLLATYEEVRNKFYGGGAPTSARTTSELLRELDELRKQLDQLR